MSPWLDLLWLFFLLALFGWVVATLWVQAAARWALRPALPPGARTRRAWLLVLLPWLVPVAVIAALSIVAAAKSAGLISDHCIAHGPGHPHICFAHLPTIGLGALHAVSVALVLIGGSFAWLRFVRRERRLTGRLTALRALAGGRRRLRVLEEERPVAFAAGILDSVVLISRGLLRRLSPRQRRIVLAHELAHLRHRDLPRNLIFETLLFLHTPWSARPLRAAWRQALEERADDRVAARYGADAVAETLLKVIRVRAGGPAGALSVAGTDPVHRVARLLASTERPVGRPWFELGYAALLLATLGTFTYAHHPVETLLGWVTRL